MNNLVIEVEPSSIEAFRDPRRWRSEAFTLHGAEPGTEATIQAKVDGKVVGAVTGILARAGSKRGHKFVLKPKR